MFSPRAFQSILFGLLAVVLASSFSGCAKKEDEDWGGSRAYSWSEDYYDNLDQSGPSNAAQVEMENSILVAKCAARVEPGNLCRVPWNILPLNNAPEGDLACIRSGAHDWVGHDLSREEDGIHIGITLRFDIPQTVTPARAEEMLGQVRACIPKVQEVWSRYGLRLDLAMERNSIYKPRSHQDWTIPLLDEQGRSNFVKYYYRNHSNFSWLSEPKQRDLLCRTILHEVGHSLSLPDEYLDPEVKDRPFVSKETKPWSAMGESFHHWKAMDFYPRHIRRILSPMCSAKDLE